MDSLEKLDKESCYADMARHIFEGSFGLATDILDDIQAPISVAMDSNALQLLKQFNRLTQIEKREFLTILGQQSISTSVSLLYNAMPLEERQLFIKELAEFFYESAAAAVTSHMGNLAEEMGIKIDENLMATALQKATIDLRKHAKLARENARKAYEEKRNRKSSLENIKRNVKICDMRLQGLSQGIIAKKYDKTATWVRNIEKEELKWRRLLAKHNRESTEQTS